MTHLVVFGPPLAPMSPKSSPHRFTVQRSNGWREHHLACPVRAKQKNILPGFVPAAPCGLSASSQLFSFGQWDYLGSYLLSERNSYLDDPIFKFRLTSSVFALEGMFICRSKAPYVISRWK